MNSAIRDSLLVADIGNSTIDVAHFEGELDRGLPRPSVTGKFGVEKLDEPGLLSWIAKTACTCCHVGSVNGDTLQQVDRLVASIDGMKLLEINHRHFDLPMIVREPDRVGIDRVAAAAAANRLRRPERPAIVICSGSAITVNVVSANGEFLGGLIAPGLDLAAHTLATRTDQLPMVRTVTNAPTLIGNDTVSAIQSGVFWMTVCGLDGLLGRLEQELAGPCDLFGTGGSFHELLDHLAHDVRFEPNLVLSGLALATP